MRNRLYLCAAALLASTAAAAAQSVSGCVAGDANPSSVNARCGVEGLPAISEPLSDNGSALDAGRLDQGTTSSVRGDTAEGSQSDTSTLDVPSYNSDTNAGGGLTGSSGSVTGNTEGNADISGGTSTGNRVGGSAITGTSGISTGGSGR
jgi:hypothetical protein